MELGELVDLMPNNRRFIKQPSQVVPGRPVEWQVGSGETTNDRRAYAIMRSLEETKVEFNSTGGLEPMTGGSGGTTTFPTWIDGDFGVGAPPPADCRLYVVDEVTFAGKSAAITAITQAASAVVTVGASHTFVVGEAVEFSGVAGMVEINGLTALVTAIGATTITVNIDSSAFTAYTSGGVVANPTGQLQKLCFTTDTEVHSGMRGLRMSKDAGNTEPLGLTLYMGANPVWDIGMDSTVETYPDLVLAYSHDLETDNLRIRADTAQVNLGRIVGKPSLVGSQLTITSGNGATITGITNANPMVVTVGADHLFAVGEIVNFVSINTSGVPGTLGNVLNGTSATITAVGDTTITFGAVDSSAMPVYTGGGTAYVTMNGIRMTQWGNSNGLALFQSLGSSVSKRVKFNFNNVYQFGTDADQNGTGDLWYFNNATGQFPLYFSPTDKVFVGGAGVAPVPTAKLHIGAGAAAASGAPLKLTSGTNLTTPEAGAVEYNGTELFFTRASTRLKVLLDTPVDGTNITFGTTTGTKLGTATTEKIGFWNATPVVRPSAWTQTFATADKTISAYTSDPESSAYTGIDNLQVGTVYATVADLNALRVAYENLRAMAEDVQQGLNALIDDMQTIGLAA
jgi:Ubiquitin-activating enzyme E1 FCCH domain